MKPMLADEAVLGNITYPKLVSEKYNGVRGLIVNGTLLARSLKKIPNRFCQEIFSRENLSGLDGELVVGKFNSKDVFTKSTSGVMSRDGEPDVYFYVFDSFFDPESALRHRLCDAKNIIKWASNKRIKLIKHNLINSDDELLEFHSKAVAKGFEGVVLRDPEASYKFGRSTKIEQGFLRFVQWHTSEAVILAIEEKMHNKNPQVKDELGHSKRSLHKANMIPTGVAGSIFVRDLKTEVEFSIAIGGDELQKELMLNRKKYLGKIIRYKYKEKVKTSPRFPQFEGFRDIRDLS